MHVYKTLEQIKCKLKMEIFEIADPYKNRKLLAKIAARQKGVYMWVTHKKHVESAIAPQLPKTTCLYVGHSKNLYRRVTSYFMPSVLKTPERRVLRYFKKKDLQISL